MKYLLLLAVLLVVYFVWRSQRLEDGDERGTAAKAPPPALPQEDMVRCPVCSVHLPRNDALAGSSGRLYCSPDHRLLGGN